MGLRPRSTELRADALRRRGCLRCGREPVPHSHVGGIALRPTPILRRGRCAFGKTMREIGLHLISTLALLPAGASSCGTGKHDSVVKCPRNLFLLSGEKRKCLCCLAAARLSSPRMNAEVFRRELVRSSVPPPAPNGACAQEALGQRVALALRAGQVDQTATYCTGSAPVSCRPLER